MCSCLPHMFVPTATPLADRFNALTRNYHTHDHAVREITLRLYQHYHLVQLDKIVYQMAEAVHCVPRNVIRQKSIRVVTENKFLYLQKQFAPNK